MASYYNENTQIYLNGSFVKAADARVDLYGQTLHYGYGVFEGIRSYRTVSGETKIFKAEEHYERLRQSALALNLPYDYTSDVLISATYELLRLNELQDAYIRPLVYSPANMSFNLNSESYLMIAVWKMEPFLGNTLLKVMTSSFQRPNPKGFKIHAKATGHYVNSIMASQEAKAAGYDEALLTDMNGFVAEGPGANMFFEKDGKIFTPALGNILPGITRSTVLDICREAGIAVEEKFFTTDDIKGTDAAFFCGTAAEVIGWESIDGVPFKKEWSNTLGRQIQLAYKNRVIEKTIIADKEPVNKLGELV
ncbi:MAG: branched-chain-amino-acid transaminase [Chitinophagaceae bacterium]|nr:MAG: branched-chain-amino-acid transaminase [Chitinophagaceae bacterium]